MVHQLVYVSSSTSPASQIDIDSILMSARRRNPRMSVTGVLISIERTFFQVLEGPEDAVQSLFALISRDKRHKGVLPLLNRTMPERRFPKWSMGWASMPPDHPLSSEIIRFTGAEDAFRNSDTTDRQIMTLLNTFVRNNAPDFED